MNTETVLADAKNLRGMIVEIANALQRIDDERSFIKDAVDAIADKHQVEKKYVRKLAKTYFKNSFNDEVSEMNEFETLYNSIMEKN